MAITAKVYGLAIKAIANKEIDWDSDTVKAVLCSSSYTPNQDTHQYASSLSGELSGGGYARVTLAGKASSYDAASNTLMLDCNDYSFLSLTGTFRYVVYVDTQTGSDATSPLIAYLDFGSDQPAAAQDVAITVNAGGVVSFVVA